MTALAALAAAALAAGPPAVDLEGAATAWRYFERNTDARTGLVRSVEGYPSTTAWDQGSSLLAAIAARELGLVTPEAFDVRVRALLATLARVPLHRGALPNKAYDTSTGAMTDYGNRPAPDGIGTSAVDTVRLASALVLLGAFHPAYRPEVEGALRRWDLCRLVRGGELYGVHPDASGALRELQEGRLGYEQYAARSLALLGRDAAEARRYDRFATEVAIFGVQVPRDRRDARRFGAVDAVVTEPWVLAALELGPDAAAAPLARRIFEVQKRRWEVTGTVTAVSEDHLDRAPWFVYDGIWADGAAWRTVGPDGKSVDGLRALSTKAALALATLYPDDPYAGVLRSAAERARDPQRGWYAGVYEDGGALNRALTANTNAVVLEAALFARIGPLHPAAAAQPGAAAWLSHLAAAGRARACPEPEAASAVPTGIGERATGTPRGPRRGRHNPRVTGAFFADYRGTDRGGFGGIATAFPYGSWFLRLGGEATPNSRLGRSRYLWGFGYDDWRDGTLSATVHNWGPVRPEDGLGVDRAELNVGYKVPRLCAPSVCAALFPSVTVPFQGGPHVGTRLTLTVHRRVFGMAGFGWTVPGVLAGPAGTPTWRFFWGFGLLDWRPGTVFITYHDWGPDERARNGIVAVGVNWRF